MNAYSEIKSPSPLDDQVPWCQRRHPMESGRWWSYVTLAWMDKLVLRGGQTPLTEQDVWPMAAADSVEHLYRHVMQYWQPKRHHSILRLIWRAFRYRIVVSFFLFGLYAIMSLIQPLAVKAMMEFLQHEEATTTALGISNGYLLAFVLFFVSTASVWLMDFACFYGSHIGINVKSVVSHMVYKKSLTLSASAKTRFSSGEIITMSSVDIDKLVYASNMGQWPFVCPVLLVACYVMLGFELGYAAALAGGASMAVFIFFGFQSAATIGQLRRDILTIQAQRVKLTNEMLQGIRVVKLNAWEVELEKHLEEIRESELARLKKYHNLRIINSVLLTIAPVVSLVFCLMVFVAQNRPLTVQVAFTALAYMNIARQPCSVFSKSVVGLTEALASCRRLTEDLNADEVDTPVDGDDDDQVNVQISNGEFKWTAEGDLPTLQDISLTVGAVGSGKSSLLSAILGDIHLTAGSRNVHARFSYVNQESWIQHATVKQNILFESKMEQEWYARVVSACQLTTDLAMLPRGTLQMPQLFHELATLLGDDTEIGERGINLSGGQKARVSLARAMYHREADAYLLDDPLSAQDAQVANAIFTNCIQGLLKGKTTLLALTSHYPLLPHAHRVLLMADGRIVGDGTFDELRAKFPHLMNFTNKIETHEATEDMEEPRKENDLSGKKDALVTKEDNAKGGVMWSTYYSYFSASGFNGCFVAFVLTLFFTLSQVALSLTDWFMSFWAIHGPVSLAYGWAYVGLAGFSVLLVYGRSLFVLLTAMLCSKNFHSKVLSHVLSAPVPTFFDVTPVGRILNRFSSDLDQIDSTLPHSGLTVLQFAFNIFGVVVVCAVSTPWVILLYVPMTYVFFCIQRAFGATLNEMSRMNGVSRSPLISIVTETYQGISTIRAFGKANTFVAKQQRAVDNNMRFGCFDDFGGRWFYLRLDLLGNILVGGCAFVAVMTKSSVGLTAAGLSLTYSTQLAVLMSRLAYFFSSVDHVMTSVERLDHYNSLASEDDNGGSHNQVASWPSQGAIHFQSYSMRYRDHLDLVLTNLEFTVEAGHQVGICGRTGSGKSSLIAALFRIVPAASGRIAIDNVDIASVHVTALRSALTIIPQDPVLFSGSLRFNLDPADTLSDADLWTVLQQVHLKDVIPSLEFEISEMGSNLSVGQRQLVCIARALLRRSKVVVLDEATANIDLESDRLIQQTMREGFQNVTRLIVAHRLDTILDSDRILVLDGGRVKEYGAPQDLLADKESAFSRLAQHAHFNHKLQTAN
ncbi:hypothetical protein AeNC1_013095 [Aphanomyces euteiches]|nr:hypothetical protein AeNC1_013095 [Aphanomyces euteiches]